MSRTRSPGQAAQNITQLADALAEALPSEVIDRLKTNLDSHGQQSLSLVLALALSRRGASGPAVEAPTAVDTELREQTPAADTGGLALTAASSASREIVLRGLPELASALCDMSLDLGRTGDHVRALSASERVVGIYCVLARTQPAMHLPELAAGLNNVSVDFAKSGRPQEACAAAEQAVAIRRYLSARRPDLYLNDLAVSLNNLGGCLDRLGRADDALLATREATEIRIVLAERAPSDFLPVLASSLSNLSISLAKVGRLQEADAISRMSIDISRRIEAAHSPTVTERTQSLSDA